MSVQREQQRVIAQLKKIKGLLEQARRSRENDNLERAHHYYRQAEAEAGVINTGWDGYHPSTRTAAEQLIRELRVEISLVDTILRAHERNRATNQQAFAEALALADGLPYYQGLVHCYWGAVFSFGRGCTEAIQHLETARALLAEAQGAEWRQTMYHLACIYYRQSVQTQAEELLRQAIANMANDQFLRHDLAACLLLGKILSSKGGWNNWRQARQLRRDAMSRARKAGLDDSAEWQRLRRGFGRYTPFMEPRKWAAL